MLITNDNYRQALRLLKQRYSDLPWYQRWWFSLWSYRLSSALSAMDLDNPTTEQVDDLVKMSDEAWFFNSIFGILTQFRETIGRLSFSGQPKEIKEEVGSRLPPKYLVALSLTSEENYAFFESMRHISQFLLAVAHGEYDAVVILLKNNINLLLHKGRVTDYSGRTFFYISGFQYALWALDKHMWLKILNCLPQNETSAKIKAALYKQYQELKEKGVAYELNGKRIRENHFDFENTIIKELTSQVNDYDYGIKNWGEIDKQWREGVGSAQKLLPMHVVYEYCSDLPFDPVPEFIEQPSLKKQFKNGLRGDKDENWFLPVSELGSGFAIYKSAAWAYGTSAALRVAVAVRRNLLAMETLCNVRTADFKDLESLLKEPLGFDNQLPASQSCSISGEVMIRGNMGHLEFTTPI
ncbi:MAG: F-box protein [Tatlockia sp.]|nr:F-box protein [Tatlockia sp.]